MHAMSSTRVSIMVKGVSQENDDSWHRQRALIKRSGAIYERDTWAWWLDLDPADSQRAASSLACLFDAMRKYGTKVRVMDPVTEWPVVVPDESSTDRS